ncbi:hypothetical protein M231_07058 [Tremella mesenterica]|uniref:Uncharacterized protein n=1 Tax=Tremella mesenterica TaxID=5217 RepID=A0A4Q1BEP1_TREME|nr:hypothetical protein M231_07058 [Tremella mesenterica]
MPPPLLSPLIIQPIIPSPPRPPSARPFSPSPPRENRHTSSRPPSLLLGAPSLPIGTVASSTSMSLSGLPPTPSPKKITEDPTIRPRSGPRTGFFDELETDRARRKRRDSEAKKGQGLGEGEFVNRQQLPTSIRSRRSTSRADSESSTSSASPPLGAASILAALAGNNSRPLSPRTPSIRPAQSFNSINSGIGRSPSITGDTVASPAPSIRSEGNPVNSPRGRRGITNVRSFPRLHQPTVVRTHSGRGVSFLPPPVQVSPSTSGVTFHHPSGEISPARQRSMTSPTLPPYVPEARSRSPGARSLFPARRGMSSAGLGSPDFGNLSAMLRQGRIDVAPRKSSDVVDEPEEYMEEPSVLDIDQSAEPVEPIPFTGETSEPPELAMVKEPEERIDSEFTTFAEAEEVLSPELVGHTEPVEDVNLISLEESEPATPRNGPPAVLEPPRPVDILEDGMSDLPRSDERTDDVPRNVVESLAQPDDLTTSINSVEATEPAKVVEPVKPLEPIESTLSILPQAPVEVEAMPKIAESPQPSISQQNAQPHGPLPISNVPTFEDSNTSKPVNNSPERASPAVDMTRQVAEAFGAPEPSPRLKSIMALSEFVQSFNSVQSPAPIQITPPVNSSDPVGDTEHSHADEESEAAPVEDPHEPIGLPSSAESDAKSDDLHEVPHEAGEKPRPKLWITLDEIDQSPNDLPPLPSMTPSEYMTASPGFSIKSAVPSSESHTPSGILDSPVESVHPLIQPQSPEHVSGHAGAITKEILDENSTSEGSSDSGTIDEHVLNEVVHPSHETITDQLRLSSSDAPDSSQVPISPPHPDCNNEANSKPSNLSSAHAELATEVESESEACPVSESNENYDLPYVPRTTSKLTRPTFNIDQLTRSPGSSDRLSFTLSASLSRSTTIPFSQSRRIELDLAWPSEPQNLTWIPGRRYVPDWQLRYVGPHHRLGSPTVGEVVEESREQVRGLVRRLPIVGRVAGWL